MNDSLQSTLAPEIISLTKEIDDLSRNIGRLEPVFDHSEVLDPFFSCFEAGFLRSVSWLYILYYEFARTNIEFLMDKFEVYQVDTSISAKNHYRLVHSLRTGQQHNLDLSEDRNTALKDRYENWFRKIIDKPEPECSDEWKVCLQVLLEEALSFLQVLKACIKAISFDESNELIVDQWNAYCSHYHAPHEFDKIIAIVAADIGMDKVDVVRHRKKFYESWTKDLENLLIGYNFELEARKLVQNSLLKDPPLPITTQDIMQSLDIIPGPEVGKMLLKAREIYINTPCSGKELLEKLSVLSRI